MIFFFLCTINSHNTLLYIIRKMPDVQRSQADMAHSLFTRKGFISSYFNAKWGISHVLTLNAPINCESEPNVM